SGLTTLDKLLEKNAAEKLTGFVEVSLEGGRGTGIVLMQEGDVLEAFFSDASGKVSSGTATLPGLKEGSAAGAVFNVYRADVAGAFAESTEIMESFEIGGLLEVLHDVIVKIRAAADMAAGQDVFDDRFAAELIVQASAYPFLDPFAGEFEYRNGHIEYSDSASMKEFIKGVSDSIIATVNKLGEEYPKEDLADKIAAGLASTRDVFESEIVKYGLDASLAPLWGRK
ncbi:MAG: hypothetical protein JSU81_04530, partial [Candidatus Coatesbacteria bacterium]